MSYIDSSKDLKVVAEVGDDVKDIQAQLFADAEFAGCPFSARSTSGVYFAMMGKYTHVPIAAVSKRQTCVSHSTPEAEIVAADTALRLVGLLAIPLLEFALGMAVRPGEAVRQPEKNKCKVQFQEDNEATIAVFKSGKTRQ
eukprot:2733206-Amphidinium_carterae.2